MGVDYAAVVAVSRSLGVYIMQCWVSLATRYGSVVDAAESVDVGGVIEPWVESEAMWSLFSLYEFSGWRIDGSIVRRIAVTSPVAGWTLNPPPAAAVVFLMRQKRFKRGRLQFGGLRGG